MKKSKNSIVTNEAKILLENATWKSYIFIKIVHEKDFEYNCNDMAKISL